MRLLFRIIFLVLPFSINMNQVSAQDQEPPKDSLMYYISRNSFMKVVTSVIKVNETFDGQNTYDTTRLKKNLYKKQVGEQNIYQLYLESVNYNMIKYKMVVRASNSIGMNFKNYEYLLSIENNKVLIALKNNEDRSFISSLPNVIKVDTLFIKENGYNRISRLSRDGPNYYIIKVKNADVRIRKVRTLKRFLTKRRRVW